MVPYLRQILIKRLLIYRRLAHIQYLQRLPMLTHAKSVPPHPEPGENGPLTHMRLPRLHDRDALSVEHFLPKHNYRCMPALHWHLSHSPCSTQRTELDAPNAINLSPSKLPRELLG